MRFIARETCSLVVPGAPISGAHIARIVMAPVPRLSVRAATETAFFSCAKAGTALIAESAQAIQHELFEVPKGISSFHLCCNGNFSKIPRTAATL